MGSNKIILLLSLTFIFISITFVSASDFGVEISRIDNSSGFGVVIQEPEISSTTTINNFSINGTEVVHNNMTGLQGGSAPNDFFHLTQTLYDLVVANALDWITSKWITTSSEYLYNDSTDIFFNDTLLNATIDDRGGGAAGIWTNDTDPELAEFDGDISIKNQIQFTDSNTTIIVNETEFGIYI
tara:strand:- start:1917 stop:2468 length:552 start_codon:yes stop_codon:yes gene_type:complete